MTGKTSKIIVFTMFIFCFLIFQAMIGIAYSIGFIIGPVIGALFASSASRSSVTNGNPYLLPAVLAITLVTLDFMFLYCLFEESLPAEKRVRAAGTDWGIR